MPAHKLQGHMDFQGLPISIENRKGSKRHWTDVGTGKEGTTTMKHPYGYIRGTLGTDGDAVDVFIGNDKDSANVYVVTQNKAPRFDEIDEQKVMLGFSTAEKAKLAYLAHYNNKRFFRDMKTMSVDDFRSKLQKYKGKLIKGALLEMSGSVKMESNMPKECALETEDMDLKKNTKEDGMTAADAMDEVSKALSARTVSGLTKRNKMSARIEAFEAQIQRPVMGPLVENGDGVPSVVGIAEAQPLVGTSRQQSLQEPLNVPVRRIETPPQAMGPSVVYKSCTGCGRMNKSLACVTCDNKPTEAKPHWRR